MILPFLRHLMRGNFIAMVAPRDVSDRLDK